MRFWRKKPREITRGGVDLCIRSVRVRPGDVVVVSFPRTLTDEAFKNIRESMSDLFPGTRFIVLEEGMRVGVMERGDVL